jgi:hypothetical protein
MYGGRKPNPPVILHCTTYREGGIDQHATIGGAHPGYTLPLFLHHDRNRCQCSSAIRSVSTQKILACGGRIFNAC